MKVALFGGTGFVGSYLIDELIKKGHKPQILIRPGSDDKLLNPKQCNIVSGTLSDASAIESTLEGADAVIYTVGIIRQFPKKGITFEALHFEGAKHCMDAAAKLGIKRFILMSANGVKMDGTGYQKTKFLADEYLKNTELNWTIFRPSLIFGDPRGEGRPEFCSQLKKDMLSLPIPAPLFHPGLNPLNAGKFAMSPIHVKDVARFFIQSIDMESTHKKIFKLGGEIAFTWKELIKIIAEGCGKKKWMIPAPALGVKAVATFLGRFSWFPITADQITMLMEGNVCDATEAFKLFEIQPTLFNTDTLSYLRD